MPVWRVEELYELRLLIFLFKRQVLFSLQHRIAGTDNIEVRVVASRTRSCAGPLIPVCKLSKEHSMMQARYRGQELFNTEWSKNLIVRKQFTRQSATTSWGQEPFTQNSFGLQLESLQTSTRGHSINKDEFGTGVELVGWYGVPLPPLDKDIVTCSTKVLRRIRRGCDVHS